MDLEQRVYNGARAREVLENEAFNDALAAIRQEITELWKKSPARDNEGREKLYQLLRLADMLEATLRNTIDSGKLATADLKHKQTLAERAKSLIGLD